MSVTINVKLKRVTDKAILVEYNSEDIWLPKSQVESNIGQPLGAEFNLDISDWIAGQKNIVMDDNDRYIAEASPGPGPTNWVVKDTSTNPLRIMCACFTQRDAEIIAASLEMTKNKL